MVRHKLLLAAMVFAGTGACTARARTAVESSARDSDVYRAVLQAAMAAHRPAPTTVVIADSTEAIDRGDRLGLSDPLAVWRQNRFSELPADVAAEYRRRNERRTPLRGLVRLEGERGVFPFVSEVDIDTVRAGQNTSHYGSRPYERVILTFSAVGFSRDGRLALVYMGLQCGGRCGLGAFFLMRLTSAGWKVGRYVPIWIS